MPILPRSFYARPTADVARELLGAILVRRYSDGREERGRVVETEAYPPGDPSSHCYRGPTPRSAMMFARPGTVYVYRIYGAYFCLNLVTEGQGTGSAILVRGLAGIDDSDGPGKLCRRLQIDLALNGADACGREGEIRVLRGPAPPELVVATTRIGITQAADWPLRFYLLGATGVSRRNRAAERETLAAASSALSASAPARPV